jgi:hypothetical protein
MVVANIPEFLQEVEEEQIIRSDFPKALAK